MRCTNYLPAVFSLGYPHIQILEDFSRVPPCACGGAPTRHCGGNILPGVSLVVLLVILVWQTDQTNGVVYDHFPGKFDHSDVVLERFGLAVVLVEDNLVDINVLVVTAECVVRVALPLRVQVVLPHPDGGGAVAPGQLGHAVSGCEDKAPSDESPPALVHSPPSMTVAQVNQPGELTEVGLEAAHDTLRKGFSQFS